MCSSFFVGVFQEEPVCEEMKVTEIIVLNERNEGINKFQRNRSSPRWKPVSVWVCSIQKKRWKLTAVIFILSPNIISPVLGCPSSPDLWIVLNATKTYQKWEELKTCFSLHFVTCYLPNLGLKSLPVPAPGCPVFVCVGRGEIRRDSGNFLGTWSSCTAW